MTTNDEFSKIRWLTERLGPRRPQDDAVEVRLGIGDDAAVVDFGGRPTVVTVDTHVEGVHFRRSMMSSAALGARAFLAATSDVWAMGATPSAAVVALTLPDDHDDSAFRALVEGLDEAAHACGAPIIGGNLSGASILSITTTVFGTCADRIVSRAGAEVGDVVYVTGTLGAAALGFAALEAGAVSPDTETFIARWRRPPSHAAIVESLRTGATAAIDVSDGLLQDLDHLCHASNVGATVRGNALPRAPGYDETCRRLGLDPLNLALTGGEDYEVLFCAPAGAAVPKDVTDIGRITEGPGIVVLNDLGKPVDVTETGFRHFS
ncbi:MAG: thiamine-phosphate kinase [Myxococcota bacterium]